MDRLNIELFKKVRERIATIPQSYDQNVWLADNSAAPCGTAACLAGETIICAAPTVEQGIAELKRLAEAWDEFAIPNRAAELLGLSGDYATDEQETAIFRGIAQGWPQPYRQQFESGDEVGAAVAFLDHIIATGEIGNTNHE